MARDLRPQTLVTWETLNWNRKWERWTGEMADSCLQPIDGAQGNPESWGCHHGVRVQQARLSIKPRRHSARVHNTFRGPRTCFNFLKIRENIVGQRKCFLWNMNIFVSLPMRP